MFPSPHDRRFSLQSPVVAEQVSHLLVACLAGRAGRTPCSVASQYRAKHLSFSSAVSEARRSLLRARILASRLYGLPCSQKQHSKKRPALASYRAIFKLCTQPKIFSPESGPIVSNRPIHPRDTKRVASEGCGHSIRARRPGLNRARNPLSSNRYVADSTTGHV